LKVDIDLSDKVDKFSRFVQYNRVTLDITTEENKTVWSEYFEGNNNLDYHTTIATLNSKNIKFTEEIKQVDLPALPLAYSGSFDVIGIMSETVTDSNYSIIKKYKFGKITYTDNSTGTTEGRQLVAGDRLLTTSSRSEFIVQNVEKINNEHIVTLAMKSGYETVNVGTDVLRIISDVLGVKTLTLDLNFNEKQIIFIKAVEPNYHVTSYDWSEGMAFDSNLLQYVNTDGNSINLNDYFISNVYDLEKILMDYIENNNIPGYEGITPDAPVLNLSNFKVHQNNAIQQRSLKTNTIDTNANELSRLRLENSKLQADIVQLDIDRSQGGLSESAMLALNIKASNVLTQIELNNTEINKLSTEITALKYEYNSKIETVNPTYAIKGFWNIPTPKKDLKSRFQDVIGFRVQYRYLDLLDNPTCNVKIKYEDLDGEVRNAIFSEWVELKTLVREKVLDNVSGKYVWEFQDLEKNIPNVNQVDIPIEPYEQVEIRVKAISEAGYPNNPLTSEWSNSIIVTFPDNVLTDESYKYNTVDTLLEESVRAEIDAKLAQIDSMVKTLYSGIYNNMEVEVIILTQTNIDNKNIILPVAIQPDTLMMFNMDDGLLLQEEMAYNLNIDSKTIEFTDGQMAIFTNGGGAGSKLKIIYKKLLV